MVIIKVEFCDDDMPIYECLCELAQKNRRTIQSELLHCFENSVRYATWVNDKDTDNMPDVQRSVQRRA